MIVDVGRTEYSPGDPSQKDESPFAHALPVQKNPKSIFVAGANFVSCFQKIGVSNPVCPKFDRQKHRTMDGAPCERRPLHSLDMEAGSYAGPFPGNLGGALEVEIAIASTGHVLRASANMSLVMMNSDLLGRILCSLKASQATIDTLIWMKRVSKLWPRLVKGMLVDPTWMHSFIESGNLFVNDIDTIVGISVDHWVDLHVDDTVLREFLEQMQQHGWHEAVQYHGIVALWPSDSTIMLDLSAEHLELLLIVNNNAMGIHQKSLRVQNAALSLLDSLFRNEVSLILTLEHLRAASGVTRALLNFGDGTAGIAIVESILSTMTLMLEKTEGFIFQNEFRREGAIELVIKCMRKSDCSQTIQRSCVAILMQFCSEHVPFILSCGIERVLFMHMTQRYFDIQVQIECMVLLAYFYTVDSPMICNFPDLSPLKIIFDNIERFKQDDHTTNSDHQSFFGASMYLLSSLMANRDNFEVHVTFVHKGYVKWIASKMQHILQTAPIEFRDEIVYTHVTKILSSLGMFPRLHTSVACPSIKVSLERGMLAFPTNEDVQRATCSVFRRIFFVPSQVRRPTPGLSLVKLILDTISNNPNYLLMVECVLTLDLMMDSRQVLIFVSQHDGFNIIATTFNSVIGIDSTSTRAKRGMGLQFSHSLQSEFAQASFSLLNKLPLCPPSVDFHATILFLARAVTQVILQHKTEVNIQSGGLLMLEKYMIPHSKLHQSFRMDTGLSLMYSAIELPDLSSESRAIAQKIISVCSN
jgi:hypothetical protein